MAKKYKEKSVEGNPPSDLDVLGLAQLWAGQFQHFTSLGVGGSGGVLVLIQLDLFPMEGRWWLALVLFAMTAIVSAYGQVVVVDEATQGIPLGKKPKRLRGLALMLLGAAGGALFATLLK